MRFVDTMRSFFSFSRKGAILCGKYLLSFLLPHRCLLCGTILLESRGVCSRCWPSLQFITPPFCEQCNKPLDLHAADTDKESYCGDCLRTPPPFSRARAAFSYNVALRSLVLRLKHADQTEGVSTFVGWMLHAGTDLLRNCDLVVPVPLHRGRLFVRRYNQAALLAWGLGRSTGKQVVPDLLVRHRKTAAFRSAGRRERERTLHNAFSLNPVFRKVVRGRKIVLIDDIATTGATLRACSKVLLASGAADVTVLTLGRVPLGWSGVSGRNFGRVS